MYVVSESNRKFLQQLEKYYIHSKYMPGAFLHLILYLNFCVSLWYRKEQLK